MNAKRLFMVMLVFALAVVLGSWNEKPLKLFLIGDSTMADKPLQGNPERGWGMVLPSYFNNKVEIENHARNGHSGRTFIEEGRARYI